MRVGVLIAGVAFALGGAGCRPPIPEGGAPAPRAGCPVASAPADGWTRSRLAGRPPFTLALPADFVRRHGEPDDAGDWWVGARAGLMHYRSQGPGFEPQRPRLDRDSGRPRGYTCPGCRRGQVYYECTEAIGGEPMTISVGRLPEMYPVPGQPPTGYMVAANVYEPGRGWHLLVGRAEDAAGQRVLLAVLRSLRFEGAAPGAAATPGRPPRG